MINTETVSGWLFADILIVLNKKKTVQIHEQSFIIYNTNRLILQQLEHLIYYSFP